MCKWFHECAHRVDVSIWLVIFVITFVASVPFAIDRTWRHWHQKKTSVSLKILRVVQQSWLGQPIFWPKTWNFDFIIYKFRLYFDLSVSYVFNWNVEYRAYSLRSEIPSGMCAKLRTVAASNNRDHARNLSYCCLLTLHIQYNRVVLHAHPVRGESHN